MTMDEYESYESLPRELISYHRHANVRNASNIYVKTSNDVYSQVQKPTKKDKLESKYNKTPKILTPIFVVLANSK